MLIKNVQIKEFFFINCLTIRRLYKFIKYLNIFIKIIIAQSNSELQI
jgi:hypothetical protein